MEFETAILVILALFFVVMVGIVVVLILLMRKWQQLIKIYPNHRGGSAEHRKDLKKFDQLPQEYRDAVDRIIGEALGDERPDMNYAFRAWQAKIFEIGAMEEEDHWPDCKMLELEALAFRGGWEGREQMPGVPSGKRQGATTIHE
jgi:hypothetical protein